MKKYVNLTVTVELTTDNKAKTDAEAVNLAKMHVKNCITDNPDADDCTITDCCVMEATPDSLAEFYNGMTCAEKDKFLELTENE